MLRRSFVRTIQSIEMSITVEWEELKVKEIAYWKCIISTSITM